MDPSKPANAVFRFRSLVLICAMASAAAVAGEERPDPAQQRWARNPHGPMLERILPPAIDASRLPEPRSQGARLTSQYCVQCHYLPSPQMHSAQRWKSVVDRMIWRMQGNGNMGALMKDMLGNVKTPNEREIRMLTAYLQKHGQNEMRADDPALNTAAGQVFALACTQCHVLPDPGRHTADEWPPIVNRMKRHMEWTNSIVGAGELRTTPELRTEEIVRFLQRHARPNSIRK